MVCKFLKWLVSYRFTLVGTYRLQGKTCEDVVYSALEIGYRHIDTASVYRNEEDVGKAIKRAIQANICTRSELFITTKISPRDQGYDKALEAIESSMEKLGIDYLDLILLHWPGTQKLRPDDIQNKANRGESVKAMKTMMDKGKVRSIGVSNFTINHLEGIDVEVHVNQFELHPLQYKEQADLIKYCRDKGIVVEAYSSLGEGKLLDTMEYPELDLVAKNRYGSIAQILLAWAVGKGFVVMPKASSKERLQENWIGQFIVLDKEDDANIENIIDRTGPVKYCWDPTNIA
jgi:diketogulonate reductase-like aldo/keto reductase